MCAKSQLEVGRLEHIPSHREDCKRVHVAALTAYFDDSGTHGDSLTVVVAGFVSSPNQLQPSEGRRVVGHKVVPGYQAQDFSETMDPSKTLLETLRAAASGTTEQSIRNLLGSFLFSGDAIEKTVGILSGGEKMRIAFARLLMNRGNLKPGTVEIISGPSARSSDVIKSLIKGKAGK